MSTETKQIKIERDNDKCDCGHLRTQHGAPRGRVIRPRKATVLLCLVCRDCRGYQLSK